ncbi:MAG: acyl--CoA ligase, partial [Deltaproteobacteria bacterium]|nr:acyl--CoA ligase [Deltaproteobacteria bacterium]
IVGVDQDKSITFQEMNAICSKVANFLKERGVNKDDRISLIGKNSIETMILFYSVLRYGAIINPINSEESRENVRHILRRVKPRFVFYDREFDFYHHDMPFTWIPFEELDGKKGGNGELFSLVRDKSPSFKGHLGCEEDIAEILFTSGTTETPKGVVISREGLFYMVSEVIDKVGITSDDILLEYRAYNWASPQLLTILSSMFTGATLVLARKFSRTRFANWLKENHVTISSGVPTVINILVTDPIDLHKRDVPHLKFITSSSAPLSVEKQKAFERIYGIPINQMAGMSEAGWMMGNPPDRRKTGSVGTPFKYKQVDIVNGSGKACDVLMEGEIMVKGKSMGLGYLKEDGTIQPFPEGGFSTGDLGYRDHDGYIFITGRKKDVIIRGGVNISPMEINDRLMEHPKVKEAVTIGIPDKIYGEEVASFIVPVPGAKIEKEEILEHCRKKLPEFKIPKVVRFIEAIPRTKTGKVSKPDLLRLIQADQPEDGFKDQLM